MLPDIVSREGLIVAANESPSVTFITDAGNRVIFCNPAWEEFAIQNGAPELASGKALGIDLLAIIPLELRNFYQLHLERARNSGEPWNFLYECSSPDVFRACRMRVYPLLHRELLFTNSLVVESPHALHYAGDAKEYANRSGIVTMCAHCRCSKHLPTGRWDYVPIFVRSTEISISHGLCRTCREYFYPPQGEDLIGRGA
jgi:hypothetical protein